MQVCNAFVCFVCFAPCSVWLNGQFVGVSKDSRLPAEFEVTHLLSQTTDKPNQLAVQVRVPYHSACYGHMLSRYVLLSCYGHMLSSYGHMLSRFATLHIPHKLHSAHR